MWLHLQNSVFFFFSFSAMFQFCDLVVVHVNTQQTFFLNQKILSAYSGKLKKKIVKQGNIIEIHDFPGGPDGFELVSRFCYNGGRINITVSNVCLLHCCAFFLDMTEKLSTCNLLKQTETFLDGTFNWSWNELLVSIKSCESFLSFADSTGLVEKLVFSLLAKIAQNSETCLLSSSSSSSSSPDAAFINNPSGSSTKQLKQWWYDGLTILPPVIIEKFIRNLGAYGTDNNSLILTRFILYYLKKIKGPRSGHYSGLADTAIYGVILAGKGAFSCRGLFSVLRVVSGFGLSNDCRVKLERLIGSMLDQATVDDLLVCGNGGRGVYDVNLVLRLVKIFVNCEMVSPVQKMKKVGGLIDKYLSEISPDQNLKTSKFLGVAESLPDYARDCFDGVYRAIDIYLESHQAVSFEERTRLCRCLNYKKLTLEVCKDLAKNPKIPPNVAVQALISQKFKLPKKDVQSWSASNNSEMVSYSYNKCVIVTEESEEEMRMNMERMQWRVMELEKACKEMKHQMSKLVRQNIIAHGNKSLPRLC